jgi:hypothetical protein
MHTVVVGGDRRVRTLAVATIALFLFGVVGAATVRPTPAEEARLVSAAAATTRTGTARASMVLDMSFGGNEVTAKGDGLVDFGAERASMTMDMPAAGGAMRIIADGDLVYMQGAMYQAVAQGKPWVATDTTRMASSPFSGMGTGAGGADVLSSLRALQDKGVVRQVREVGTDEVRGVRTVKYEGEFDPDALMDSMSGATKEVRAALRQVRMDSAAMAVWVSDDDLVRRMTSTFSLSMAGSEMKMSMTIELFDFGIPVQIDIPPADQVHRMESPLRAAG